MANKNNCMAFQRVWELHRLKQGNAPASEREVALAMYGAGAVFEQTSTSESDEVLLCSFAYLYNDFSVLFAVKQVGGYDNKYIAYSGFTDLSFIALASTLDALINANNASGLYVAKIDSNTFICEDASAQGFTQVLFKPAENTIPAPIAGFSVLNIESNNYAAVLAAIQSNTANSSIKLSSIDGKITNGTGAPAGAVRVTLSNGGTESALAQIADIGGGQVNIGATQSYTFSGGTRTKIGVFVTITQPTTAAQTINIDVSISGANGTTGNFTYAVQTLTIPASTASGTYYFLVEKVCRAIRFAVSATGGYSTSVAIQLAAQ